jgi:hypothetical protein
MIIDCHTFNATVAVLIAVLGSGVDPVGGFYISKAHPDGFPDRFLIAPELPTDVRARLSARLRNIPDIMIENDARV